MKSLRYSRDQYDGKKILLIHSSKHLLFSTIFGSKETYFQKVCQKFFSQIFPVFLKKTWMAEVMVGEFLKNRLANNLLTPASEIPYQRVKVS
jgi:hypothetical protein